MIKIYPNAKTLLIGGTTLHGNIETTTLSCGNYLIGVVNVVVGHIITTAIVVGNVCCSVCCGKTIDKIVCKTRLTGVAIRSCAIGRLSFNQRTSRTQHYE
jgi:hypothetical protein